MPKTIQAILIFLLPVLYYNNTTAQNNKWILGDWAGIITNTGNVRSSKFVKTLTIDSLSGNAFYGRLINEVHDKKNTKLDVAISGTFTGSNELFITQGDVLFKKDPPSGSWLDCSGCMSTVNVIKTEDSIVLAGEVKNCKQGCNGLYRYYKLLPKKIPSPDTTLIARQTPAEKETQQKTIPEKPVVEQKEKNIAEAPVAKKPAPKKDTVTIVKIIPKDTLKAAPKTADTIKAQLKRTAIVAGNYTVTDPDITIQLFDNATIDGDIVSVYHNKERIITKKMLAREPLVYKIKASPINRTHEFILVAENLGAIPPNTALMRITAGKKVYELIAKTNLQENATITIEYTGE